jgi:hypothetical protein
MHGGPQPSHAALQTSSHHEQNTTTTPHSLKADA